MAYSDPKLCSGTGAHLCPHACTHACTHDCMHACPCASMPVCFMQQAAVPDIESTVSAARFWAGLRPVCQRCTPPHGAHSTPCQTPPRTTTHTPHHATPHKVRKGGVRCEWDEQRRSVYHCYGHGGCGWSLFLGCAEQVADDVLLQASRSNVKTTVSTCSNTRV